MKAALSFALVLALAVITGMPKSGAGQTATDAADRAAIEDIIRDQVAAFKRDDGTTAFSYASPNIQSIFGTAEVFMRMVRQGYQPVYRPQVFEFRELVMVGLALTQKVFVIGPDGLPYHAPYIMERQADGSWRIDGCYLTQSSDEAA